MFISRKSWLFFHGFQFHNLSLVSTLTWPVNKFVSSQKSVYEMNE